MKFELWSTLPSEIVERTLSFLSVPVLCRFRTVCKRWNSLIFMPEFGALCLRHARQDACFLVARHVGKDSNAYYEVFGRNHGWSFMDVNARRWYIIKQDGQAVYDCFHYSPSVAMDGGLVCQFFLQPDISVFVFNPIARTSRLLPSFPDISVVPHPGLELFVDNVAHYYKVFVMPDGYGKGWYNKTEPLMVVFDSRTNEWRSSTDPPEPQTAPGIYIFEVRCSAFYDGLLYILICSDARGVGNHTFAPESWLWSYNHFEDTWNETGVDLIDRGTGCDRLVMSDKRLFLGSWLSKRSKTTCPLKDQPPKWPWSYEIIEVNIVDRTINTVFQMPGEVMAQVFDVPAGCLDCQQGAWAVPFPVETLGFGKSIVLMCQSVEFESKVSIIFDLSTCSWEHFLPINPLFRPKEDEAGIPKVSFGTSMNLILPANTAWVDHELDEGTQGHVEKSL